VSTSVMKWSEGVSNRVSIIIKRYVDHMRFAVYMIALLITFFHILLLLICTNLYKVVCFVGFCLIFKLCILIVMYVPFWILCFIVFSYVLFVCKCVLNYCHRVSTQLQLTYISYHIISLSLLLVVDSSSLTLSVFAFLLLRT
jgi:hypothetical protein